MIKGYLTVFLSLSLSVLSGFLLVMTFLAMKNANKVRFEYIGDIALNSALAEYDRTFHDRFGLLYVDLSYLGKRPDVSNLEERISFYMEQNQKGRKENSFGQAMNSKALICQIYTAAAGEGASMKYQAAQYQKDRESVCEAADIFGEIDRIRELEALDPMGEWSAVLEEIAGIELPKIQKPDGTWEEVPLENPADRIFSMAGSDILFLAEIDVAQVPTGKAALHEYISHREILNGEIRCKRESVDEDFMGYLCEKLGAYSETREDSLLQYQREYLVAGKESDVENLREILCRILQQRFSLNVSSAFGQSGLYGEALSMANEIYAVQLKPEFAQPVAKSMVYACAFLESVSELKGLMQGGRLSTVKEGWSTPMEQLLSGTAPAICDSEGMNYVQYLSCMVMLLSERNRNLRTMDLMEMDVRYLSGNRLFQMDWCVECFEAALQGQSMFGSWSLDRVYGYY